MGRGLVYTLHLWPPLAHAKHYTGWTRNLPQRLLDHAMGRGGRLPQVQVERGGSWVVAQTEPGGPARERQLKQHGASRRCKVCKAVDGYQAIPPIAGDFNDYAVQHGTDAFLEVIPNDKP